MASPRYRSPEETEAMVVRALTSHGIAREVIGKEFGLSGPAIGHIRAGTNHAKVRPDLPRWRGCWSWRLRPGTSRPSHHLDPFGHHRPGSGAGFTRCSQGHDGVVVAAGRGLADAVLLLAEGAHLLAVDVVWWDA